MNNYVSTEKSLKRWLKTRVKVTMATVVGFLIAGTVVMGAEISKETYSVNKDNKGIENINVSVEKNCDEIGTAKAAYGIEAREGVEGTFNGENLEVKVTNIGKGYAIGVGSCVKIIEGDVKATNSKINLGDENTKNINIDVKNDGRAVGIFAYRSSLDGFNKKDQKASVETNGESLVINVYSKTEVTGIHVQNGTTANEEEPVKVVINSKNTIINAKTDTGKDEVGLTVLSQGKLEVNGNLEINASTVLATRGDAVTTINADGKHTIKLNGDIEFAYDGETSGTPVEADVTLNLSNAESYLKGKISVTGKNIPDGYDEVEGMKLGLSNGGTWKVTGDSFVNDLTMNSGILEVTDDVDNINVDRLHGNNGTALFAASVNGEEIEVTDGKLNISEVKDNTNLEVGLSGVNTDDLAENNIKAETVLEKLTNKVVGKDGANIENIDQTLFVDGGTLTGKVTAELDKNGNITNIQQAKDTPTTAAIRDLTAINYLSWKQEMSSLSQRMGELRDSSAEHGVWARVYGGKVENGSQYDNEYQTYQVGYDKKYTVDNGRVYLGYLVSYTDGETDYSYGTGENYSVGAGIYATWMNNNGHYVDVLYKVSRLNNKFDMNDTEKLKGDYDTYGISLSAEYGKRFDITDKWFAEPSVGMHLGRLGDETYTTDGGIEVSQDSIYTAEGRVGATVGYKFSDKGNVYARTHVVKEFAGDVDTEYMRNGVYASTSEDFGDTWLEFGVGVNYRFTENMNVYADIERTGDSTVETKWQGNLGFRYEF